MNQFTRFGLFAAGLFLAGAAAANPYVPGNAPADVFILKGGDIFTLDPSQGEDGVIRDGDVLVRDGRIAAVGRSLTVPDGAEVIELEGRHVYPGLVGLDTTLGLIEISAVRATDDREELGDFTPEVQGHIAFNADSDVIPTVRSNGLTHIQVVPQDGLVSGRSSVMHTDGWHWEDALVKANDALHVRWPSPRPRWSWWGGGSSSDPVERAAREREAIVDFFDRARAYHQRRAGDESSPRDERLEAMRGVFDGSVRLFIHADDLRQIEDAVRVAEQQGLAFTLVGGRDAWRLADRLASTGTDVVYTATFGTPIRDGDAYDTAFRAPAVLADAGVRVALAYSGYWDTRNLAFAAGYLVAHGLDRATALAMITRTPAEMIGLGEEIGRIAPGYSASLLVSDGDVLDYREHDVEALFIDGRRVNLNDRHKALADKYRQRLR
jgi:imidazolonepropionase-like amidohydrolase